MVGMVSTDILALNQEERQRYFRLIYIHARVGEIVDSFYTFVQDKGFVCQKCDAIRSGLKHEKDCFVGRMDSCLMYLGDTQKSK